MTIPQNFANPRRANLDWTQSESAHYHAVIDGVPAEVRRRAGQHGYWLSLVGDDERSFPSFVKAKADAELRARRKPPLTRPQFDSYWQSTRPRLVRFAVGMKAKARSVGRRRRKPPKVFRGQRQTQANMFDFLSAEAERVGNGPRKRRRSKVVG